MARKAAARSLRPRKSSRPFDKARHLSHQALERREMLAAGIGPQLISVSANSGENFRLAQANTLTESPTQLTFRFDGSQQIDPATLSAISIVRSGGDGAFGPDSNGINNDIRITPGFLGFGDSQRIVIARFAETLPDDQYRISIAGYDDAANAVVGLKNIDGKLFDALNPASATKPVQLINYQVELGPQVVSVVPQPIVGVGSSKTQARSQIYVYFNNDLLSNPAQGKITTSTSTATVVQTQFYNLFFTNDTVENTDGFSVQPTSVTYDPALNRAVLEFGTDLALLTNLPVSAGGSATYRLRIGTSQALPAAPNAVPEAVTDAGNIFSAAQNLGATFNATPQSIVISGQIQPTVNDPIQWPGFNSPGVRDNRRDAEITGQPDTTDGIDRYYYNFAQVYGQVFNGGVLDNAITEAQKQRAREVLSLYSEYLGVEFIETEDRGLQIVTGNLRALVDTVITGPGVPLSDYRINDSDTTRGVLILDAGENWFDGYGLSPDARPSWFTEALRGVGSLLGLGSTFEQVPGVASGSNPALYNASLFPVNGATPTQFSIEPDFLSTDDIIPAQALHRPETRDVDLYSFKVDAPGQISIETFAQRLDATSSLNTEIKLWKFNPATSQYDLVARNDDFYSNDSFVGIDVSPNMVAGAPATAEYVIGITATGNDDYNPNITGSGSGGRSQGNYEMRVTFQNKNVSTIKDTDNSSLDGDGDGIQGGDFNFWFRTAKTKNTAVGTESRTLFVDKSGVNAIAGGTLAAPYKSIDYAFSQARSGDIVRILPSAGVDGKIETTADNPAYEIGRGGSTNAILSDGETFNVPQGVTVMIDAGAILKLRNAKISVGSERIDEDRSKAALQILGTPILVNTAGAAIANANGQVLITSYNEERRGPTGSAVGIGIDTNPLTTSAAPGDWAGIEFRHDFDYSEGRPVWETEGIFLDYSSYANIQYGGGSIASTEPIVTPLQMIEARPTLIYNTIRNSRDAAISADPNSFLETNFHAPIYQRAASFTSDYDRVGPDIRGNTLTQNSINGLFVRVRTPAAGQREPMTVSGRFDDRDIVHSISEVLVLQGQPGGSLLLQQRPDVLSVTVVAAASTTGSAPVGTYDYRVTFINADGSESLASLPTLSVTVAANQRVTLDNLPTAPTEFVGRRLYRRNTAGDYVFVTQLDRSTQTYVDNGKTRGGLLPAAAIALGTNERLLPRYDARLSIDPGLVIKLNSARIEAGFGADFYAEGIDGKPIVFTSRLDDTYGAGGTFDTNNDGSAGVAAPGDWGGLVFRQGSTASLDYNVIRFGGGSSATSGGSATFNPVEILQADVRVANSLFANNAAGSNGDYGIRDNIGFNSPSTIFVRGAQPIIIDNIIRDNAGAAISINPDALNYLEVNDPGRSTGSIDLYVGDNDNQGALIAGNKLARNSINGLFIRNESLTTESVWDDTDIVHVVQGQVYAWNHQYRSGLRLKSDPNQSLVVKFQAGGSLNADHSSTDIEDSIGGTLQVLGQPGFPVVLTSINDCHVGAGFTPDGLPQNDTIESGVCSAVDTGPQVVDVAILLDDTGSFTTAGLTLATVFPQMIAQLELALGTADLGIAITRFEDYPATATGLDRPFILNQPIISTKTPNFDAVIDAALKRSSPGGGGDIQESDVEALWQIATGAGFDGNGDGDSVDSGVAGLVLTQTTPGDGGDVPAFSTFTPDPTGPVIAGAGTLGGVGWRANADQKIIILATDASFKYQGDGLSQYIGKDGVTVPATRFSNGAILTTPGGRGASIQATIDRLVADGIKVIGLGTGPASQVPLEALATLTGGTDPSGKPLFFTIQPDNAPLISDGIVKAVTRAVGTPPAAGDWQGIVINSGANDRNVAFIPENEQAIGTASGLNAIPSTAQVIGSLARSETSADENRRAGFNVRGTLSQNSDLDVYSFFANGGTEVYLDIDDTSFGLDTIVELIDRNGNILAQSNNSNAESNTPSLLVNRLGANFTATNGAVLPLLKSGAKSVENPNALDAGMRVILNGSSNTLNQYYVRVRSNNNASGGAPTDFTSLGLSNGQYQLAVRLRETDEIAGSTVKLADIRFATNAIDLPSAPSNSPLGGESAEELNQNGRDVNDAATGFNGTQATGSFGNADADPLGSLNSSNRGVLRVSGVLGNQQSGFSAALNTVDPLLAEADLDVYRVDILDGLQNPDIITENRFVSTIFDIDYSGEQLGRANTSLAVYNAAGQLILHSRDSNVADDQGRPLLGVDQENLAGGSVGTLDAYIGPVEIQAGTYYVVVSSAQMIPQSLDQLFNAAPTDPNVRILPINSVRNLAEFNFDESPVVINGTAPTVVPSNLLNTRADLPLTAPLFDNTSIVPYTLEDLKLFVTLGVGLVGNNTSTLATVDPFTGLLENVIGDFARPVSDLAIRRDGQLFSYTLGDNLAPQDNTNTGQFLNVSPADGTAAGAGDDSNTFRQTNPAGTGVEAANPDSAQLLINAIAFDPIGETDGSSINFNPQAINNNERVFIVGNRDNNGRGELPQSLTNNIVYSADASTGAITNQGSTNAAFDRVFPATALTAASGPASIKQEYGIVDVGQFPGSTKGTGGSITGLAQNPAITAPAVGTLGLDDFYAVTNAGGVYSFSVNDTRSESISVGGVPGVYDRVLNSTFYGNALRDPQHVGVGAPIFSSLTFGPRSTQGGAYQDILFATTTDGWLYTLRIDEQGRVQPAHVLANGKSAVQLVSETGIAVTNVTGVAFSIREENPFHTTTDRQLNPGHGLITSADQSRINTVGGTSLYFGFEPTTDATQNTLNTAPNGGNLAPGGVQGSTVSRPFSLEGYSSGDKPALYFNYFLTTEPGADYAPPPIAQVDSFRVFAAGDDGQWRLLVTDDSYRRFSNVPTSDEYDYYGLTGIPVQEAFENTNAWRQARVDLAPLAGNKNVQLRFDYSTAGGMNSNNIVLADGYLTEIQSVPGEELVNGSTFSLQNTTTAALTSFEFVRGGSFNVPAGANVLNGQRITINRASGTPLVLTMTTGIGGGTLVQYDPVNDNATAVATKILTALTTLDPTLNATRNGAQILIPDASAVALTPARFNHVAVTVPAGAQVVNGQSLTFRNSDNVATTVTLSLTASANPLVIQYTAAQSATQIAFLISNRLNVLDPTFSASRNGNQLILGGASAATLSGAFALTSSNFATTASQRLPDGNYPVFYNRTMTSTEVQTAIRNALVNGVGRTNNVTGVSQATIENFDGFATNRVRVYQQRLFTSSTNLTVGFSTFLPGDEFGPGYSASVTNQGRRARGGQNNAIEGLYIDDITIGFAERGEMVYNAPANRNFVANPETRTFTFVDTQQPEYPNETLIGGYTLEIRKGAEFGVPEDYDPIRLGLDEQESLGRSFDTNDRLTNAVTLIAPPSEKLLDGDKFTLSNGSQRLTFEFDSNGTVTAGNVRIPFIPVLPGTTFNRATDDSAVLATAIRDAINSTQSRNVLHIVAAGRDGAEVGLMTGNRIDLFGSDYQINVNTGERVRLTPADIQVNPSSGRFIKLDLVGAETPYGRETGRTIPVVDQDTRTVTSELVLASFAMATATNYVNGSTDVLVGVGKIGDSVGTGNGNELIASVPSADFDVVKIFLRAGDRIDLDVYTNGFDLGNPFENPQVRLFDANFGIVADSGIPAAFVPGSFAARAQINAFTAAATGYYYVVVNSADFISFGEYQLTIRPTVAGARDVLMVDYHSDRGDTNVERQQGQIIIESNFVSDFATTGIRATFNGPGVTGKVDDDQTFASTPLDRRPGSAALLRNDNTARLLPGTIISNNVVIASQGTGILFSGETAAAGDSPAPVPFGRIVNNTVVFNNTTPGSTGVVGIDVAASASPTVINNIISGFATGLNVSLDSNTTTEAGNAYQNNGTDAVNVTLSSTSFVVPPTTALFQNASKGNYIPAAGSLVIDSSFASLSDRDIFYNTVKNPVGIAVSPIIAPTFDAYGIPRFDDSTVTTPSGVGSNVFIDRGGIDRADFNKPRAVLVTPPDFIFGEGVQSPMGDNDPDASFVRLPSGSPNVAFFEVQFLDPAGSGPLASTINDKSVTITEDGVLLTPGVNYIFGYSDNSRIIRLTPTAGLWRPDSVYQITLNNKNGTVPAITDLAGNVLETNQDDGSTRFTIIMPEVQFDFGDAPASYGTLLAANGARHTVGRTAPLRLGALIDTELDGLPNAVAGGDDLIIPVVATLPNNSTLFTVATAAGGTNVTINPVAPVNNAQLRVTVGLLARTFEFVSPGIPVGNTGGIQHVALPIVAGETPSQVAIRVADAIRTELGSVGSPLTVNINPATPTVIELRTFDDEDGVSIGTLTFGGNSFKVFLRPGAAATTTDPADVLGFLNPLDPSGTSVNVNVTGTGFLDAFIDFNRNGIFDSNEQVVSNLPVVNGNNSVRIVTPANLTDGTTLARFRVSVGGNLRATGVAIGGEVEDYQVQIINDQLPIVVNDSFTTVEDTPLTATVKTNDTIPTTSVLPSVFYIATQGTKGAAVINPSTGVFTYTPSPDANGQDTFTYGYGIAGSASANVATVTINITAVNDAPSFPLQGTPAGTINILETDLSLPVSLTLSTNVLPGPATAADEVSQQVTFTITNPDSASGLFLPITPTTTPTITVNGKTATLTVFPAPDAVGNAVIFFDATDNGTVPAKRSGSITIAIQPVNDAPRPNPKFVNKSDTRNDDDAWAVDSLGTITYTLKEDNTGALGVKTPYTIDIRQNPAGVGYQRVGILDAFSAGPKNELDSTTGGSQLLKLDSFQSVTALGGTIRSVLDSNNNILRLEYVPPLDFNNDIGALDSFTYVVSDDNPNGGETYDLATMTLNPGQLTTTGTVLFNLKAVNDPPQFTVVNHSVAVLEDTGLVSIDDFVSDIFAGPPNTAFDETDLSNGQHVTFSVTAVSPVAGLFKTAPTIDPSGVLSFETLADGYGQAVFEVRATDTGKDNATRGDIVSSTSQLITINIRPVNDRPVLKPNGVVSYTLNEDALVDQGNGTATNVGTLIPLRGTSGQVGLLDVFDVGPPNEAANINPGGNQTISLSSPIPASTVNGGTLTKEFDTLGKLIGLRYSPRANFNGTDSFVYGVIDNGVSADLAGNVSNDFREGFTTVTLQVTPRNDAPIFGGAPSVTVLEDATTSTAIGQTNFLNWATNIQAGPAGAADELNPTTGQIVTFTVNPVSGNPAGLFTSAPTVAANGTLSFKTALNANGVAVFTVVASDNGTASIPLDFNTSTPARTFTITVTAVNDAPTFTPGPNIVVNEDSGVYSSPNQWATSISPGPADEVAAGQTVHFVVTTPTNGQALFTTNGQPTVSDDGFLRFTPAANASGTVTVLVEAVDSDGARSVAASLTITIGEVNDVTVARDDTFAGNEDTAFTITPAQLLANDVDPDLTSNPNEKLKVILVPAVSVNGAALRLTKNTNGDVTSIQYDPRSAAALQALAPGQTRADTFTYKVQDAAGAISNLATITVNVQGINDAPILLPDSPTLVPGGLTIIRPLDNDTDIDGTIDPKTLVITLQPAFGSLVVQTDGTLVYSPFPGFRGQDIIRYTVKDNLGAVSNEQTITIDVNKAPIAVNDNAGTFRDEAFNINVAANDSDPDGTLDLNSIQIVTQPVRGTATIAGGGIVRYLPEPGFTGVDSFQYTINDNGGRASNVAKVLVQTVASRLQNPKLFTDVNASGETSPVDALLVLNILSRNSRAGHGNTIPVLPTDKGPNFYDANGDLTISVVDALRVINQIRIDRAAQLKNQASGEGEAASSVTAGSDSAARLAAPMVQLNNTTLAQSVIADTAVTLLDDKDFQPDFSTSSDDFVASLVIETDEQQKSQDAVDHLAAIDAAWADVGD